MQQLVFEDPYEFIPPYRGRLWSLFLRYALRWYLRKAHAIDEDEVRGAERLRASIDAGHGVVMAMNHCSESDPMTGALIARKAGIHMYVMASWHIFKQSRFNKFMIRRMGAFSIYREGVDRKALNYAIDTLVSAERPLLIFPEGAISRTNDRLAPLMEGTSFIARTAARRRARADAHGRVVIHPIALRYHFRGDVRQTLDAALTALERRVGWHAHTVRTLRERINRLGRALVALKEIEHVGDVGAGDTFERLERLVERMLEPIEREWTRPAPGERVVTRVKNLRAAILPDLVARTVTPEERQRRWEQLTTLYFAQELSLYRRDYLPPGCPAERLIEVVQAFEEDLGQGAGVHGPWKAIIDIGEAIVVSPERSRGNGGDPLLGELATSLQGLLDGLAAEFATPDPDENGPQEANACGRKVPQEAQQKEGAGRASERVRGVPQV